MPKVTYINQLIDDEGESTPLFSHLLKCFRSDKYEVARMIVAYATIPAQLRMAMEEWGGKIEAIFGGVAGGEPTSAGALKFADENFAKFHVGAKEPPHIFHPKLYLFKGEKKGAVFVGSNNLTGGGLGTERWWNNFEACVRLDYDFPQEQKEFNGVWGIYDALIPDCVIPTREFIKSKEKSDEQTPRTTPGDSSKNILEKTIPDAPVNGVDEIGIAVKKTSRAEGNALKLKAIKAFGKKHGVSLSKVGRKQSHFGNGDIGIYCSYSRSYGDTLYRFDIRDDSWKILDERRESYIVACCEGMRAYSLPFHFLKKHFRDLNGTDKKWPHYIHISLDGSEPMLKALKDGYNDVPIPPEYRLI